MHIKLGKRRLSTPQLKVFDFAQTSLLPASHILYCPSPSAFSAPCTSLDTPVHQYHSLTKAVRVLASPFFLTWILPAVTRALRGRAPVPQLLIPPGETGQGRTHAHTATHLQASAHSTSSRLPVSPGLQRRGHGQRPPAAPGPTPFSSAKSPPSAPKFASLSSVPP